MNFTRNKYMSFSKEKCKVNLNTFFFLGKGNCGRHVRKTFNEDRIVVNFRSRDHGNLETFV